MSKLQHLLRYYLYDACPKSQHQRRYEVIFRGQISAYAGNLSTAIRQAVLLSFYHLRKDGRFFPVYVRENRTYRIVSRIEDRDRVLKLGEAHLGLRLKKQEDSPKAMVG